MIKYYWDKNTFNNCFNIENGKNTYEEGLSLGILNEKSQKEGINIFYYINCWIIMCKFSL